MKQSGARLGERAARRGELQTGLAKRTGQGRAPGVWPGRAGPGAVRRGRTGRPWRAERGGMGRAGPGGRGEARRGTG